MFSFYLTYKNQTFPKCQRCRSESLILTNDLQLLDTQLAVCRREGETSYDANGDEIIPRWVPSHLDLRQRTAFSLWVTYTHTHTRSNTQKSNQRISVLL